MVRSNPGSFRENMALTAGGGGKETRKGGLICFLFAAQPALNFEVEISRSI